MYGDSSNKTFTKRIRANAVIAPSSSGYLDIRGTQGINLLWFLITVCDTWSGFKSWISPLEMSEIDTMQAAQVFVLSKLGR